MTYEAEKFTKKKFPIILFCCHESSKSYIFEFGLFIVCMEVRVLVVGGSTSSVGLRKRPPKKYSQTNNNLPKKASSTNKKASLERIILNIE